MTWSIASIDCEDSPNMMRCWTRMESFRVVLMSFRGPSFKNGILEVSISKFLAALLLALLQIRVQSPTNKDESEGASATLSSFSTASRKESLALVSMRRTPYSSFNSMATFINSSRAASVVVSISVSVENTIVALYRFEEEIGEGDRKAEVEKTRDDKRRNFIVDFNVVCLENWYRLSLPFYAS